MNTTAIIDHIVDWLATYSKASRTKGFVVGVSGGIDSAVTSALAAKTGLKVKCIEMPIHQHPAQVSRATNHIAWLQQHHDNVIKERVDLTSTFDGLIKSLPLANTENQEMALVNTRARLRMTTLYYFAGLDNLLVAGTGNKIEDFGIGFFTKYGDGGVDLSPIADLTKTQVYAIAKALGIINEIMIAPPTDGLWGDDRTDEEQIGASYAELEWAMNFKGEEENTTARERQVLHIYRKLHTANRHKMLPIPVCQIPEDLF